MGYFPDPEFRISAYGVANGAPRATCSQNFSPLAAVVLEITSSLTIIKYRITKGVDLQHQYQYQY